MQIDILRSEGEGATPVEGQGTGRGSVRFCVRSREDEWAAPFSSEPVPSGPGRVAVVRASRPTAADTSERGWVVELDVDLRGATLDPEHWLRYCQDFLVYSESGHDVGVVDAVELAPGSDRVAGVVVLSGWLGRHVRRIAVADVQAIVPGDRRLIVRGGATSSAAEDGLD